MKSQVFCEAQNEPNGKVISKKLPDKEHWPLKQVSSKFTTTSYICIQRFSHKWTQCLY